MKEQILAYKNQILETWNGLSKRNKYLIIGALCLFILAIILIIYWSTRPNFVPLYNNLQPAEAGEIVAAIEARGIPVELSPDGKTISVPKSEAARLKVELSHQGIPRSGHIDYGIFSENMGFGMTDRQFNVVERDAMQNELRYLIEQIDGINQAKVMITLPEESIWLTDEEQTASASVIIHTAPGLSLSQAQINGLYHLISKSVPKLPVENIVIMNQHMQTLDLVDESELVNTLTQHQQQRKIKQDIERDIQRQLQQMLGTIIGPDKVIVSVFANIDFSVEKREEHLVEPVVDGEGIAISVERIQKSFEGEAADIDGLAGTGETDIAGYPAAGGGQNSEYEELEERINSDVNRIFRQIESSPYLITDLSISVGVEPPIPDDVDSLTEQVIEDIRSILRQVVATSLPNGMELTDEELNRKITVFPHEFRGRPAMVETGTEIPNLLLYGLALLAVLAIGGVSYALVRRRRKAEEAEEFTEISEPADFDFTDESEEAEKRKRIERLARTQPEEFVKLLRTWLAED